MLTEQKTCSPVFHFRYEGIFLYKELPISCFPPLPVSFERKKNYLFQRLQNFSELSLLLSQQVIFFGDRSSVGKFAFEVAKHLHFALGTLESMLFFLTLANKRECKIYLCCPFLNLLKSSLHKTREKYEHFGAHKSIHWSPIF